jgi:hypothetical protein
MTETGKSPLDWAAVTPVFGARLREPKKPERPSDGAIAMAQKSYDGFIPEGETETLHVMRHRFPSIEAADLAADELKRAGSYTTPVTTVTVTVDDNDKRSIRWRAGEKRGRKS